MDVLATDTRKIEVRKSRQGDEEPVGLFIKVSSTNLRLNDRINVSLSREDARDLAEMLLKEAKDPLYRVIIRKDQVYKYSYIDDKGQFRETDNINKVSSLSKEEIYKLDPRLMAFAEEV